MKRDNRWLLALPISRNRHRGLDDGRSPFFRRKLAGCGVDRGNGGIRARPGPRSRAVGIVDFVGFRQAVHHGIGTDDVRNMHGDRLGCGIRLGLDCTLPFALGGNSGNGFHDALAGSPTGNGGGQEVFTAWRYRGRRGRVAAGALDAPGDRIGRDVTR